MGYAFTAATSSVHKLNAFGIHYFTTGARRRTKQEEDGKRETKTMSRGYGQSFLRLQGPKEVLKTSNTFDAFDQKSMIERIFSHKL